MKYIINGLKRSLSKEEEKKIESILDRLSSFINDRNCTVDIGVKPCKNSLKTEISLVTDGESYHYETVHDIFLSGLEISVRKLEDKIRKRI
ncbi:MAG: hypothetical protein Q4D13_02070 [Erysipelotrichaceae bacterium]|nr:hypothetical protein [Erysipelotrichaceae bacterium]